MSYESVVLHGRDHEAVTVVLPVPRLRTIYTHRYILYIGSGKRAPCRHFIHLIQPRSGIINALSTAFPTFLARYSTVFDSNTNSTASRHGGSARSDLCDGLSWKIEIKLMGIRITVAGSSLFDVIGEEGQGVERKKVRNEMTSRWKKMART